MIWNWAGAAVEMIAGFVVAPLLVRRLGTTGYGLWIVIGSLSGYFGLLDLGLRGSVGRQLAFHRAHNDHDATNRTLSSAFAILGTLGIFIVAAALIATGFLDRLFDPPAELIDEARLALLLVGINLAITFPLQVFDGNLWAAQRFDVLNFVDIPMTLARVGLTYVFVRDASDIVVLATITLLITATSGAIKALLSFQYDRSLRIHPRYVSRATSSGLFGYGWWSFMLTVARLSKTQLSPLLIGAQLGIALVTPFSIARRLQDYAHKVLWTATGVVVPVATAFHARSEISQQQNLFIEGGKYSTAVALYFLAFFLFLGRTLIGLWMGSAVTYAITLLIIISAGEFIQMTQSLTGSIILATARHKYIALLAVIEAAISVTLVATVAKPYGLIGVCFALAVPQVLFSGFGTMVYGCKVTGVSIGRYLAAAMLPAALAAAPAVAILALITTWRTPVGWPMFVLFSAVYSLAYVIACMVILKPAIGGSAFADLKTAIFGASS
jgi:O-antigen/teichoic acid export membrane protein